MSTLHTDTTIFFFHKNSHFSSSFLYQSFFLLYSLLSKYIFYKSYVDRDSSRCPCIPNGSHSSANCATATNSILDIEMIADCVSLLAGQVVKPVFACFYFWTSSFCEISRKCAFCIFDGRRSSV